MKKQINCHWQGKMAFEAEVDGHKIMLDASTKVGGENKGPTPKPLLLVALAGCTSMDVVSLLKKMRVELDDFNVKVTADTTDEHPKHYSHIHILYEFKGENIDKTKVEKAVNLSIEKYCGVNYMLSKASKVIHKIKYL